MTAAPNTYRLHAESFTDDDDYDGWDDPWYPETPDEPDYPGDWSDPEEPSEPETSSDPEQPASPDQSGDEPADPLDPTNRAIEGESAPLNDWGCDEFAPGIPTLDSYGPYGQCCDDHDTCYEKYTCTYMSWFGSESSDCQQCNFNVLTCADQPVGPGPSICASATDESKKCGKYRSGPMRAANP